jgi:3-carboxy-cis,cis-muconate cycloisomerase
MRRSSSPSEQPHALFDGVQARGGARSECGDAAWLSALLEVEAALARAAAGAGAIPVEAATAIVDVCASLDIDIPTLAVEAAASGNPVVPLVEKLRAAAPESAAEYVHFGATSQDIHDTASMLIAHRALAPLLDDLAGAAAAAADLARRHRDTPMAARTLLQQAVPTTFGLKAAGWMLGLDEARCRLDEVRRTRLAVQYGGAAGTLAAAGRTGLEIVRRLAGDLGLVEPVICWHTDRTRVAELAGGLGEAGGASAKPARDVILLAQNEVAEVSEGAPGGSSAMAHKRNPIAAISAAACAAQTPGLVATLLHAMPAEHERGAGPWHAEWRGLRELLIASGSAAAWLRESLFNLVPHPEAMAANLRTLLSVLQTSTPDLGSAADLVDRALERHQILDKHGEVA